MRELIWSPRAYVEFTDTYQYCFDEFGEKTADKFEQQVLRVIEMVLDKPRIGLRRDEQDEQRKFVVNKYNVFYYTFTEDTLTIESLFDGRQDPSKAPGVKG